MTIEEKYSMLGAYLEDCKVSGLEAEKTQSKINALVVV